LQKQTIVKKVEKNKNRREGRGRVLALSRHVYRLQNNKKDTYHVESESCDSRYYFVRYNPSVFEWCSCKDFESNRTERCKHIFAVEFAIRFATVKEVEHFPEESIRTLNDLEKAEIEHEEYNTSRRMTYEDDEYSF